MRAFYTTTRCGARDTVVVEDVRVLPDANAGSDQELGCTDDFALLDGSGSVNDASVIYQWEDAQGGLLSNAVSFQAAAAGTYYFRATDTISGCQAVDTALVALSSDFPLIDTGEDLLISCAADTVTVNARLTGVPNFSFEWVSQDSTGSIVPGTEKTLLPRITAPGKYELVVTNTDNGCTSRDTVVVSKEGADYQLSIAASGVLDCTDASVQLEASASEFGPGYAAEWSGLNSQPVEATGNPLIVSVSQAGTYQVLVRDENSGCEFTAEVEVLTDGSLPIADAGGDRFLSCPGEPLFLDGSNSSGSGELSYQWTVLSGDGSVENPNGAVASVTEPGTYQLRVSSGDNGCSALATAVVSLDPALIPAAAGDDAVTCDHGVILSGNLPPGSTGQWTTATAAAVEDPGQATTFVENLAEGDNLFVWTLSHPNCPDYSSDEVVIAKEPAPVANDDSADLPAGEDRLRINLAANDQFRANSDWIVNIVVAPSLGSIEAVEGGSIDYVANPGDYGIETFTYELCMLDCNLCDTAVVRVNVNLAAVSSGDFPNAITPNGDGVNDELVFPLLVNAFDSWPDNQLIIFNRWGNVVYEAKPYTNNWQGENSNGQQLPDGTYYYVLRLDISNGVIYKGDITILNGQNR